MPINIGFISTRFTGTDGVSLENSKWAEVLWQDRHVSFWYSGRSDRQPEISHVIPEAYFGHPENIWINDHLWGKTKRPRLVSERIMIMANYLKQTLYNFVERFKIDMLIPQNVLAIPMHIPLGIAVTEFLAETGIPTIAHHHDFFWERSRFTVSAAQDYLDMAFPPNLPNIRHAVINHAATEQLGRRKGVSSLLIPNVIDFAKKAPKPDAYLRDFKKDIGLNEEDRIILQPTRIVPRKGIEHAIRLVSMLKDPRYKLVISHEAGDEGLEYKHMIQELAHEENVDIRFIDSRLGEIRQYDSQGNKIYTLWDVYPFADFVTYPSIYEGFGNALLEAIYFRIPILVNRYAIFIQDIEPKGFNLVVMDGIITPNIVKETKRLMEDTDHKANITKHNYETAQKYYSYNVLHRSLRTLMTSLTTWNPHDHLS